MALSDGKNVVEALVWFSCIEEAQRFYTRSFASRASNSTLYDYWASDIAYPYLGGYVVTMGWTHACRGNRNHEASDGARFIAKTCGCGAGKDSRIRECDNHRMIEAKLRYPHERNDDLPIRRQNYGRVTRLPTRVVSDAVFVDFSLTIDMRVAVHL